MICIPMKSSGSYDRTTILSLNQRKLQGPLRRAELDSVHLSALPNVPNRPANHPASVPRPPQPAISRPQAASCRPMPKLHNLLQKGQKMNIGIAGQLQRLRVGMGWNTADPRCDIDLSAYLLDQSGKVPDDDWFVFYGQTHSPDASVYLNTNGSGADRETADIDFTKLSPSISRIVFVLTIHEAFTHNLNFSMVKDAYIRLMEPASNREICSFLLTDYYANVISMMLGELYLYNHTWKFHAIGNGVAKDLAGLCGLYGVEINK